MSWTDERVSALKKLWAEGHSASQIAKQLGGVTRNAVIGKVHRWGLSGRAKPSSPARKAAARKTAASSASRASASSKPRPKPSRTPSAPRTPRVIAKVQAPPPPPPLEAKLQADGSFASILTITDHMCKWPIGDPGADNFRFCGRKTDPEEPYCLAHSRVAYQPSRRRGASSNTKALGPQPTSRKRLR